MPEKREFRSRTRLSGVRDAKLIIIAAEGTNTEKQYFDALKVEYANTHVHVEVLPRLDTSSSPKHVLDQLNEFKKTYKIKPGYDELWLVIDIDRWGEGKIAEIARLTLQKHYELAISNPCFELWLLLHHRSLSQYTELDLQEFRTNWKDGTNRTRLGRELLSILGRYNKLNLAVQDFIPFVRQAIERSMSIDIHPEHRWPNDLGTRVYKLASRIVTK